MLPNIYFNMKLLSVTFGALLLFVGAIGIVLPLVPGLVLIAAGVTLLYSNNSIKPEIE